MVIVQNKLIIFTYPLSQDCFVCEKNAVTTVYFWAGAFAEYF